MIKSHKEKISKGMKRAYQEGRLPTVFKKGKKHSWQKGTQYKSSSGYWMIWKPEHPRANSRKYVKRAVLVVEKYLGRCPLSSEAVHHINDIKDDDRPENLYLFPNNSKHIKYHKNPFPLKSNLIN